MDISIAQEPYTILKDNYRDSVDKVKILNKSNKWMINDTTVHWISTDYEKGTVTGVGNISYENKVVLEKTFLTPRINEKTRGYITYDISIEVKNTKFFTIEFSNFCHTSYLNAPLYNFGVIPMYSEDFTKQCRENPEWCKLVWRNITKIIDREMRIKLMKVRL